MLHRICIKATLSCAALIATTLGAASEMPDATVILTIQGAQSPTQDMQFSLSALEALDQTEVVTTTVWTEGVQTFQGVSLKALAELLAVTEGSFEVWAANDYLAEIPVSDAVEGGPIIAYRLNGAQMSLRDKGPLWLIYPYDSNPRYRSEVIYSRSVWQLDRIIVVH